MVTHDTSRGRYFMVHQKGKGVVGTVFVFKRTQTIGKPYHAIGVPSVSGSKIAHGKNGFDIHAFGIETIYGALELLGLVKGSGECCPNRNKGQGNHQQAELIVFAVLVHT
ncbi:MAG: hypothetical protein IPJ46_13705 [Anaerolineales bacterium]|nr:hypothetical protein [Anaerolineales bacterium]